MGDGTHLNRETMIQLMAEDERYRGVVADYVLEHRECIAPKREVEFRVEVLREQAQRFRTFPGAFGRFPLRPEQVAAIIDRRAARIEDGADE